MPPTEKSEMPCFDFDRVPDLNRQDGETISMDYQDLFGLDVIEKCREEAEKSDEVFRTLNIYSSDFEGYGRNHGWCRSESGIDRVEDLSLNTGFNTLGHVSDELHKEYTDLSSKPYIENSLESLRTAIDVTNIPTTDKHNIEQAVTNLQEVIAPPVSGEVGGGDGVRSWSVIKTPEKVAPISVEEDRVREALGLPTKTCTTVPGISYNPTFSGDRERNTEVSNITGELFTIYTPAFPPPPSHTSPATPASNPSCLDPLPLSPDPALCYPSLPSGGEVQGVPDSRVVQGVPDSRVVQGVPDQFNTKLVPYRIRRIEKENKPDLTQRLTRDEKAAKNLNIPYSVSYIINCSMEEFNDILNNKSLANEQIGLCRDIRRRGKNKIAAQNCRKRKIDQICNLEEELDSVRTKKRNLLEERELLMFQHMEWVIKIQKFEKFILESLGLSQEMQWEFSVDQDGLVKIDCRS